MKKKIYKRNVGLIVSIFFITLTSIFINIISTISIEIIPEEFRLLKHIYDYKFYILIFLMLFNIFAGYIPLFHFFIIGGRRWLFKQFIPIMFNSLFAGRIKFLLQQENGKSTLQNNWYRITCYKYIDKRQNPINFNFEFMRRWILCKTSKYVGRTLNYDSGYLVCYYRYGMEDGVIGEDSTSVNYHVSKNRKKDNLEIIRGIAGLSFVSEENLNYSLNHKNVNTVIKKLKTIAESKGMENLLQDNKSTGKSLKDNISKMKETIATLRNYEVEEITIEEENVIIDFMNKTYTDFNAMFGIGNGNHSNHFLGFKIVDKLGIWGVVIIDAYEQEPVDFWNIINPQTSHEINQEENSEWLECLLNSYMELLSNSITEIVFEKES